MKPDPFKYAAAVRAARERIHDCAKCRQDEELKAVVRLLSRWTPKKPNQPIRSSREQ